MEAGCEISANIKKLSEVDRETQHKKSQHKKFRSGHSFLTSIQKKKKTEESASFLRFYRIKVIRKITVLKLGKTERPNKKSELTRAEIHELKQTPEGISIRVEKPKPYTPKIRVTVWTSLRL